MIATNENTDQQPTTTSNGASGAVDELAKGEQLHLAKELEPPGYNRDFEALLRRRHDKLDEKKRVTEQCKLAEAAVVQFAQDHKIKIYNYKYDGKPKTIRFLTQPKAKVSNALETKSKRKRPSDVTVEQHVAKEKRKASAKATKSAKTAKPIAKKAAGKRERRPLTKSERDAKNMRDRARRAAQKSAKKAKASS